MRGGGRVGGGGGGGWVVHRPDPDGWPQLQSRVNYKLMMATNAKHGANKQQLH